ncbi:MAG: hypothetical protein U5L02_20200 [Rheinheimera sp.]|nr:hypothetical protein [Rheinheimera sp.]
MVTTTSVMSQDALRIAARSQSNTEQPKTDTSKQRQQVTNNVAVAQQQNQLNTLPEIPSADPSYDSVRVSSTIGKAASSGMLTRDEAVAIYQKIANML